MYALNEELSVASRNVLYDVDESHAVDAERIAHELDPFVVQLSAPQYMDPLRIGVSASTRQQYNPKRLSHMYLISPIECPLDCKFCTQSAPIPRRTGCDRFGQVNEGSLLNPEHYEDILQSAKSLGARHLSILGGDPFSQPRWLQKILQTAIKLDYDLIEIHTSGYLVEAMRHVLQNLSDVPIRMVLQCLSADSEVHDQISGVPGSFNRLTECIHYLNKKQVRYVLKYTVTAQTLSQKEANTKYFSALGSELVVVDYLYSDDPSVGGSLQLLRKASQPTNNFQPVSIAQMQAFEDGHPCLNGAIAINHAGVAYPCPMMRESPVGNVKRASLSQMIRNPELNKIWQLTVSELTKCKECEFRLGCFDCRHLQRSDADFYATRFCTYDPKADTSFGIEEVW